MQAVRGLVTGWSVVALLACGARLAPAADAVAPPEAAAGAQAPAQRDALVARGVGFLTSVQQEDGAISPQGGPGVTAIAAAALLRSGRTPDDPAVASALEYVLRHRRPDGGVYGEGSMYRNYETCLAIMCLGEANEGGRYDEVLEGAEAFLKGLQVNESGGDDPSSMEYGGAGYGKHQRPDLSNTAFLIDALNQMGAGPDDAAMQRALVFVSRCQNLESEHNTSPHAARENDGGFYYTVAAGGQSQAGEGPHGGLRSYGSMTYAGLKSMIYAGVDGDDPRVRAALKWIQANYTLDENPGIGKSGLYYYYHTFAKALDATGRDRLEDASGAQHDWRAELTAKLAQTQRPDGSWINADDRWMEADPGLVTSYALLALSHCKQ